MNSPTPKAPNATEQAQQLMRDMLHPEALGHACSAEARLRAAAVLRAYELEARAAAQGTPSERITWACPSCHHAHEWQWHEYDSSRGPIWMDCTHCEATHLLHLAMVGPHHWAAQWPAAAYVAAAPKPTARNGATKGPQP